MRQQSPQQNSLNSSKFSSQDKASLKAVKLPETKQMSNKELFLQQNTPKPQKQDYNQSDIQMKQNNPSRQSKNPIETAVTSQNNIKSASIKDLISDPIKRSLEPKDQRPNFYRSNSNNYNNNNSIMKGDDTIEKNIQRIIDERVQSIRQELNQASDQQINKMLEKATNQIKQVDQIEQDLQNSKNELKRLLNFEQYLNNTVESIGTMKKNQIEQIVQNSIENQMQQHIKNSQQFVDDMNKYKKQFDQILQGQLAYVQEAHKKYILDDADNKHFSERFKQQFEEFQKQIASNYLAMIEKLTDYAQQVEDKALQLDSKYMGQLRNLRDDLSKQIDDGMKQLKTHITNSENQLNQKVEIDQFKGLLDEYFYQTYQKYHIQIEELKEIFQKISVRDDFSKFSDDKLKEIAQKFEKETKNQHEQQINLLKRQQEKTVELQEQLAATQRQYKVSDNKIQRMFKVSGRNLGIQETYSGLQLLDNSQLVKEKYENLFMKSQQVFKQMQDTINQLQQENYQLKQKNNNENGQKKVKKLKFKPSQLNDELINQPREENKQKGINRSPSIQTIVNQQHSRKPSQENDLLKKNNNFFPNQIAISPIASIKSSQIEVPFQTQENLLSLPLFPFSSGDPLQFRQTSKDKIPSFLGSQENPVSLFGSKNSQNQQEHDQQQNHNQKTGRFKEESQIEQQKNNKPSLVSPYLRDKNNNNNTAGNPEKLFNDPQKTKKDVAQDSNQKDNVNNLFKSQEIKFEMERIPELQEEAIQRELQLEDLQQEKRKNQFLLFDTKQPTHQFQLFDEKKNPSQNLFEENRRSSLSPQSQTNYTQQVHLTQPNMVSSQNNNASIITFNPLNTSQALPTQPQVQSQIIQTIPMQSQIQQQQLVQNITAQHQIQGQILQPIQQHSIIQTIPIQQNAIVTQQSSIPLQPQQVLVQQIIDHSNQRANPLNLIQMEPNNNILAQTLPSNSKQLFDNNQNTPERTVSALNIASPEDIHFRSQQDSEKIQFLLQKPQNFNQIDFQTNPEYPQTMPSQFQDKNANQNSPMFKSQQAFNTIDVPDRYYQRKNTNNKKDNIDETKKLLEEREYLLNQQKEIIKQFYTLEAKQGLQRNQRTKSTDIATADTFKQHEDSNPLQEDYFSLNPQFQQSQNNNKSLHLNQQLNQSNNANNKSASRITKSHNDSNLEVQEIVSTLENATSPSNQQSKMLFSPLDPKNLFPLQSKEQKDHLYNLQQLSINPYTLSNQKQQNESQSLQQNNYDSQQQSSKKKKNKIFINKNHLPPAQFFSNPIQRFPQTQNKNQYENDQNQLINQKSYNPPHFNQQPRRELFPNLSNRNTQSTQNMNQVQINRNNMNSPMKLDSQSDQFTFKPSQSHHSLGSNQLRYQNQQMQTPISHNNAIQMNDLEDFNEDEIMMYSPTNQKPTYNQRKSLFQSDNESNFDEDFFFYPDHTSAASKKLASPISPINFSASHQPRSNNQRQRVNQREIIINNQQQILNNSSSNNISQSNSRQPTPPKRMTIEDEQVYEKLIKRRLLYNNKTENTKDKKLKLRKEQDGKLKDIYNKYIYDEKGNPILFSQAATTFLVNSNLIEII